MCRVGEDGKEEAEGRASPSYTSHMFWETVHIVRQIYSRRASGNLWVGRGEIRSILNELDSASESGEGDLRKMKRSISELHKKFALLESYSGLQ